MITEDTMPAEITNLAIGYHSLPAGKLANAVTWMEARSPQPGLAMPLAMTRITMPHCASYRAIFLEVGAPWVWDRVSEMSNAEIAEHFADPRQRIKGTLPHDAAPQIPLIEAEWCGCSKAREPRPPRRTDRLRGPR